MGRSRIVYGHDYIMIEDGTTDTKRWIRPGPNGVLEVWNENGEKEHTWGAEYALKMKKVKRNVNGRVVFASVTSSRGTKTSIAGATTNLTLTASLKVRANFIQGKATVKTTGTVTTGTITLAILDGTSTLTTSKVTTPTGTVQLWLTASNIEATNPIVKLKNTGIGGGTLKTITLQNCCNDLLTEHVFPQV